VSGSTHSSIEETRAANQWEKEATDATQRSKSLYLKKKKIEHRIQGKRLLSHYEDFYEVSPKEEAEREAI